MGCEEGLEGGRGWVGGWIRDCHCCWCVCEGLFGLVVEEVKVDSESIFLERDG